MSNLRHRVHFGPTAPAGHQSNWIQTIPGAHWFSYFRFYGPLVLVLPVLRPTGALLRPEFEAGRHHPELIRGRFRPWRDAVHVRPTGAG